MSPPPEILSAWRLHDAAVSPITSGLINQTFVVEADGTKQILQRLNPIFGAEVNEDIEAVTAHLADQGIETPRLVRTAAGALWAQDAGGAVWRALTFVAGEAVDRIDSPLRARAAGELLGRFHLGLWDYQRPFAHRRPGVHDTPRHLVNLRRALHRHPEHPAVDKAAPLARQILALAGGLELPKNQPRRVVHGDPKISNVIFAPDGAARCLVDLDTLARMPVCLELGDALRSWCNPAGEEAPGSLDLDLAEAALGGYAGALGPRLEPSETATLPLAAALIAAELAARFCADVLEESYFGWDPDRYPTAWRHNLVRARSQYALACSARDQQGDLERIVAQLWP